MRIKELPSYLDICIGYRLFTMIVSTIAYIAMSIYYGSATGYIWIAAGMCLSCALSSYLYKIIGSNAGYLRTMFLLEVLAHSFFIYLSGGFYSPYLWYGIGCIMLMVVLEKYTWITGFASVWCIAWAYYGTTSFSEFSYKELNLTFGIILTLGGFYILRYYIKCIEQQKQLLAALNINIAREKQRSEYAYLQLQNLYETFNLFAITNPDKVIRELVALLGKAIAPEGCLLIKYDGHGMIQYFENSGVDAMLVDELINEVEQVKEQEKIRGSALSGKYLLSVGENGYEASFIGKSINARGVFVRRTSAEYEEKRDGKSEAEDFYWNLIDLIFQNLDIYSQTEQFITMEEQNRIANEIHDTVIQKLFGMVCSLKVFENKIPNVEKNELLEYIASLKTSTELTMKELRESIYGRSFKTVNTFIETMKLYLEEAQSLSEANITMEMDDEADVMSPTHKIAIYRICCETVNNALRHGKAKHIDVSLKLLQDQILLYVKDDGLVYARGNINLVEGNGLKNMQNIAALLKGEIKIESEIGKGTKVRLCIPK